MAAGGEGVDLWGEARKECVRLSFLPSFLPTVYANESHLLSDLRKLNLLSFLVRLPGAAGNYTADGSRKKGRDGRKRSDDMSLTPQIVPNYNDGRTEGRRDGGTDADGEHALDGQPGHEKEKKQTTAA